MAPRNSSASLNEPRNPHRLVVEARAELAKRKAGDKGLVEIGGPLPISVAPAQVGRALRIMDEILKAAESSGFRVALNKERVPGAVFDVEGETFSVRLRERTVQSKHVPLPGERYGPTFDYRPSGDLKLTIHDQWGGLRDWRIDKKLTKLEDHLSAFVPELVERARKILSNREYWARREEERRQRGNRELEEKQRIEELNAEVSQWHQSRRIREYVAAVREITTKRGKEIESGSELDRWLTWALRYAERLDPLSPSNEVTGGEPGDSDEGSPLQEGGES